MSVVSLSLVGRAVVARWRLVVAVFLAVLAGVLVFVSSLPDVYSARAVVAFSPRVGAGLGAPELRALLPAYVVEIESPVTLARLAPAAAVGPAGLERAVRAELMADSSNLAVVVTRRDAAGAARVANVVAGEVVRSAGADVLLLARVVAPAVAPREPSGPARGLFGMAGLLVAGLLAVAAAVVVERARPRLRTWGEVSKATGHQVVGRIPVRRGGPVEFDDPALAAALRGVRASLVRQADSAARVVAVTSAVPGEGKTTVAAALAVTLARQGTAVVLIDADLRQRGLSRRFGFRPGTGPGQRPGLDSVLRGEAELAACLRPGPVPGLSVLPTGSEANSAELLARHLPAVLRAARDHFGVIIIDTPPLLVGGDDAEAVTTTTDTTLLVVARDTPAYLATEAATTLSGLGVDVIGAIANGTHQTWTPTPTPTHD